MKNLKEAKRVAPEFFTGGGQTVHVVPLDGPEHATDATGEDCWCDCEFEFYDNGNRLAIHRLMN